MAAILPKPIVFSDDKKKQEAFELLFGEKKKAITPLFSTPPTTTLGKVGGGAAAGITAGTEQAPVTDVPEALFTVATSGVAGAASGAFIGGPTGAVVGGVLGIATGGVKAWFDIRNFRRRQRELKALKEEAKKDQRRREAITEKWRRINRLDSLKEAKFDRDQVLLQNKWNDYQRSEQALFGFINSDAALSNRVKQNLREAI